MIEKPKKEKFVFRNRAVGVLVSIYKDRKVLIVNRTYKSAIRPKGYYLTHAKGVGKALWYIETSLLAECKRAGIDFIAIRVKDSKDLFLTRRTIFEEEGKLVTGFTRNQSTLRALPFNRFVFRKGKIKV